MARKKSNRPEELLTCHIQTKVTQEVFDRLDKIKSNSDCRTVGELARRILSKDKIVVFHRDSSMDLHMEELTSIRKELNAIGVNINQITHAFHSADTTHQKMLNALKVADQYKKVGDKVDKLLIIISQLTKKWLQK